MARLVAGSPTRPDGSPRASGRPGCPGFAPLHGGESQRSDPPASPHPSACPSTGAPAFALLATEMLGFFGIERPEGAGAKHRGQATVWRGCDTQSASAPCEFESHRRYSGKWLPRNGFAGAMNGEAPRAAAGGLDRWELVLGGSIHQARLRPTRPCIWLPQAPCERASSQSETGLVVEQSKTSVHIRRNFSAA